MIDQIVRIKVIKLNYFKYMIGLLVYSFCISAVLSLVIQPSFAQSDDHKKRIAILELLNRTKDQVSQVEISFLSNEMRRVAGYLPASNYLVMTKESMMVLINPNTTLEDCVGTCEVETGRMLGADWILTGEVIRFGKSLRVSVKLHDTRSGQYLAGDSLKGIEVEDLELPIKLSTLKLIYKISPELEREIQAKVGLKLEDQLACLGDVNQCTPSSPPAVQPVAKPKPPPPPPPPPPVNALSPSEQLRQEMKDLAERAQLMIKQGDTNTGMNLIRQMRQKQKELVLLEQKETLAQKRAVKPELSEAQKKEIAERKAQEQRKLEMKLAAERRLQEKYHHPVDIVSLGIVFGDEISFNPDISSDQYNLSIEFIRFRTESSFHMNIFKILAYSEGMNCDEYYDECDSNSSGLFGLLGLGLFDRDAQGIFEYGFMAYPLGIIGQGSTMYWLPLQFNARLNLGPLFSELSVYSGLVNVEGPASIPFTATFNLGLAVGN